LCDQTIFSDRTVRDRYARVWLVPHVVLACVTVALTMFHVFVVFAYK
jgi:hypothetical protein